MKLKKITVADDQPWYVVKENEGSDYTLIFSDGSDERIEITLTDNAFELLMEMGLGAVGEVDKTSDIRDAELFYTQ